jgi:hypothetical protein
VGKLFEKLILRTVQKHTEERNLLNASQSDFQADHSVTLQCMRLADHVTLNFNSNVSMASLFLDIENAFDTTWYSGLLYKLPKLEFSFLTDRKVKVLGEGEFSTPRKIAAGVPQGSVRAPVLYSLYINDAPEAPGTHLAQFVDDTCIYMTEKHERRILYKLQCRLTEVNLWCEHWNIKISEEKTQVICCSRRHKSP